MKPVRHGEEVLEVFTVFPGPGRRLSIGDSGGPRPLAGDPGPPVFPQTVPHQILQGLFIDPGLDGYSVLPRMNPDGLDAVERGNHVVVDEEADGGFFRIVGAADDFDYPLVVQADLNHHLGDDHGRIPEDFFLLQYDDGNAGDFHSCWMIRGFLY